MLFINTRPIDRAQPLTQCLRQSGFDVVDLPLLALTPRPYNNTLQQLYLQLLSTQIIVVVSPTAVQIGMQYLQQSGLSLAQIQHIQWIAVGKKTAQRLLDYGVESHVPTVETSEGMLSLPLFNQVKEFKRIAFWRGEGGRQFMMQQCQQHQIAVLNFLLYERYCPESSTAIFAQLIHTDAQAQSHYWMCVSSEASWRNWRVLCQQHPQLLQNCHYLVLGERLYQVLQDDQHAAGYNFNMSKILNLDPDSVLEKITELQREL